jgi:Flp pilus assembly protein TadD
MPAAHLEIGLMKSYQTDLAKNEHVRKELALLFGSTPRFREARKIAIFSSCL